MQIDDFERGFDAGRSAAVKEVGLMVKTEVERITFSELNKHRAAGREIGKALGALAERKRLIEIARKTLCEGEDLEMFLAIVEQDVRESEKA